MSGKDTKMMGGAKPFPPTSWSTIRHSQDPGSSGFEGSMDRLFRKYWSPVYFYVRRHWARDNEEAKDMTQAFFTTFFEKDFIQGVSSEKGRFRNFVLVALRNFLSKQKRAEKAIKRKPKQGLVSLNQLVEDNSGFDLPSGGNEDPHDQFESDWKKAVIQASLEKLREQVGRGEKAIYVEVLVMYDLDRPEGEKLTYDDVAMALGLTVHQVTNGLHWARKQFRQTFIAEITDQVASEEDLRAEVFQLFSIEI